MGMHGFPEQSIPKSITTIWSRSHQRAVRHALLDGNREDESDVREDGAKVCIRMKNLAISQMPQDREALLRLVKQAKDEIRDEQANPLGELGVTAQEAVAVSEQLPF
jgi:hypothetical protein